MGFLIMYLAVLIMNIICAFRVLKTDNNLYYLCFMANILFIAIDILMTFKIVR